MVSVPECGFPLSLRGSPPCHCGECSTPFHCHCGEAVRRGNPSLPLLSLRGAKRRGNPFSFWWQVRNRYVVRGNGLPRQCAHWLAMTGGGKAGALVLRCHCGEAVRRGNPSLPLLSLRGAKRRGNPFSFLGQVRNRYVARGNGLPRQCAHWLAMTGGGRCVRWSCAVIVGKPLLCHCGENPSLSLRGSVPRGDARGLLPLT